MLCSPAKNRNPQNAMRARTSVERRVRSSMMLFCFNAWSVPLGIVTAPPRGNRESEIVPEDARWQPIMGPPSRIRLRTRDHGRDVDRTFAAQAHAEAAVWLFPEEQCHFDAFDGQCVVD